MSVPEIIPIIQKYLTDKFSYLPELVEYLIQDYLSSSPKYTQIFHHTSFRNYILEHNSIPLSHYRRLCYQLVKTGMRVQIYSPSFKYHDHFMSIDKKKNGYLEGHIIDTDYAQGKGNQSTTQISVRINSTSYRFIQTPDFILGSSPSPKGERVKVGQLVLITDAHYRPRYGDNDKFRVVWAGQKYIRVEPFNPKFKVWNREGARGKKPGDGLYEINQRVDENGRLVTFRYNSSCYNQDIPYDSVLSLDTRFGSGSEDAHLLLSEFGI